MKRLIFALLVSGAIAPSSNRELRPLREEMKRLGVRSALVIASQAVDDRPVWSPDADVLAANVDGQWRTIDLRSVHLEKQDWRHGQSVAVVKAAALETRIAESMIRTWARAAKFGARKVTSRDGTILELKQDDLGTSFVITKKGEKAETLWTSKLENCHSLALSRDERYVAFICELNGVIVTAL